MDLILLILILTLISFLAGFLDAYIGIGYGVITTPVLILLNFSVIEIVPAVLLAQIAVAFVTALCYHLLGNITFTRDSEDTKITTVITLVGIIGVTIAVLLAYTFFITNPLLLQTYIGISLILIGLLVLLQIQWRFTWTRLAAFGTIAAFNKGLSASGYTPIIAGGQIVQGRNTKHAIGSAMLGKAIISIIAVILYLLIGQLLINPLFYFITIPLIIGALISAPLASYAAKHTQTQRLTWLVGSTTIILGILTISKTILSI